MMAVVVAVQIMIEVSCNFVNGALEGNWLLVENDFLEIKVAAYVFKYSR